MPVTARISAASFSPHWNAHGPTATHQQTLQIARNEYNGVRAALTQLVDRDFEALKDALNAANVPWSPGRGLP